jgi:PPIC-type PPIASE domain/SurA-like N-terminal domain
MMSLLRKHRNWLMVVIAILAIPFVFYFNKTDIGRASDKFAHIYGRDVSTVEGLRGARLCALARDLGMQDLIRSLGAGANSENELYTQFTLNRIVLRHEADRLGIRPSTPEITDFVRNLRPFRGANGFDPKKFDEYTQTTLPAMGFTEAQIEELVTDELALRRIKDLVTTGVNVPESEVKNEYQQVYGKLSVSVVRLHAADYTKDIRVTDDDIQKYYETHKAELKTEEKRKIEFVSLELTPEQKKLSGKERIDVLQKLSDRATDLTQALLEKGAEFHQVAAKFQLPVEATGEFTAAAPDPKLKADPQLAATAFQLTTQEPNSDAIQAPDGFYVLHLTSVVETRPLSLEEAKPKVVDAIKLRTAREIVTNKGAEVVRETRELLASGAPLSFALEKTNVKAEKLEPFSIAEDVDPEEMPKEPKKRAPDFMAVRNAVAALQPGDVSDFIPWEDGGIVAILEKRELPDETRLAQKKEVFQQRILTNKREIVFYEWLHDRQVEAGIVTPKGPAQS